METQKIYFSHVMALLGSKEHVAQRNPKNIFHICNLFHFILFQISFKPYKIACKTQKNIFYFME
jgi:hypothetical protein